MANLIQAANWCDLGNNATINGGTPTTLTTASVWAAAMVGNTVTVHGAGTSGTDLVATVTAFTSLTTVTISPAAPTAVTNVKWWMGNAPAGGNLASVMTMTLSKPVNAGDLLVIGLNTDPALTISGITDTAGNNWVSVGAGISNANYFEQAFCCLSANPFPAGLLIKITLSGTPAQALTSASFVEFGGGRNWAQSGAYATGNGNSTNCVTGTLSVTGQNGLIVAHTGMNGNVNTNGQAVGYTPLPANIQNRFGVAIGDAFGDIQEYRVFNSPQTNVTVNAIQNVTGIYLITAAAFNYTSTLPRGTLKPIFL